MSFLIWNQAIGEYWFNSRNSGRSIVLTADQNSLKSVAAQSHILLEGKTAAEHFGESVRLLGTWRRQELPADELPATSAYLALAILAVSYMDNASQQGMTSYWTPFKELYGCDVRDNQIPRELKSIWLILWGDIEEWANRKNGGKYGIVRFPLQSNYGVRDPHKNIRYPKSQALLKRDDLNRLTSWFDKIGLQPGENLSRLWFVDRLREDFESTLEFSVHSRRVLRDELRFDDAVDQLLAFFSTWDGSVWSSQSETTAMRPRSRLVFAFRANSQLRTGIQKRCGANWKTESKHSLFPVSSNGPALKTASPLAAIWCDQARLFIQSRMIAASDRFLIFMQAPSYLSDSHDKIADGENFHDDLRVVSRDVEPFASGSASQCSTSWSRVSGLEQSWWMFSGTANELLSESQLSLRTKELFAPDVVRLRVLEGVKIDQKRWMVGAGPSLRVDGPLESGTIQCRTISNGMTSHTTIVFEDRIAAPSGRKWPLDSEGIHQLWIVGNEGSEIQIFVSNVLLADAGVTIPGWRLDKSGWRPDVDVGREDLFVSGAMVVGDLPPRKSTATNQSRELIDAILTSTSTTRFATHEFGAHPVVTQVRRAALSRN